MSWVLRASRGTRLTLSTVTRVSLPLPSSSSVDTHRDLNLSRIKAANMALSPPTLPETYRSASPGLSLGDAGKPQVNPDAAAALDSYNTRDTVKSAYSSIFQRLKRI